MADKKWLIPKQNQTIQDSQVELTAANTNYAIELRDEDIEAKARVQAARLTHNEQETNLSAVDAKVMANKQGASGQFTSVNVKAKNNKRQISLTQVDITKDTNKDEAIVTAANITKDAEGNTRKIAVTNMGAGQTFDVPIKGNKKIKGVTVKHEGTVLEEDEQGERKLFHVFRITSYNQNIQVEKCKAIKKAVELQSKIPHHVKLRVCWKILLLIFYIFQITYPLILFLAERQHILYNMICIGIGGIGFMLQILEFDQLYTDLKEIWSTYKLPTCSCCKSECCKCCGACKCKELLCACYKCKCCPSAVSELLSILFNEILLYVTLMCTLIGFINEKTWELRDSLNYIDCGLLFYSILMEVCVPRIYYLRWLCGAINTLLTEYFETRNIKWSCAEICNRCILPLRYTLIFVILVIVLQSFMIGLITIRIYADNFLSQFNITRNVTEYMDDRLNITRYVIEYIEDEIIPEDGAYHVNKYTWYAMTGGIVVPWLSIVTYFIINQYWLWQSLYYTGNDDSGFVPKNTMIGSMSTVDKWLIFVFDPVAWVAMTLLVASFIAFCVFASGSDYDVSIFHLPNWVYGTFILCYIFMCFSFMLANWQTMIFFCLLFYGQPFCCIFLVYNACRRPRYRVS